MRIFSNPLAAFLAVLMCAPAAHNGKGFTDYEESVIREYYSQIVYEITPIEPPSDCAIRIGESNIPPAAMKRPLPEELTAKLPAAREGEERLILDNDVVLIDKNTSRTLDIIEDVVIDKTAR